MPLPNPEPIGLPAPAWLLQFLLVLTFSLHLVPMSMTVGGTLAALYSEVRSRMGAGQQYRALAQRLWKLLPILTSFTITLGVAPLLFIQLIYGKFFYPASVLTGWTWFAVIPLLALGYGMLYLISLGAPDGGWRPWAALTAAVAFLAIGAIYVSTMSLATEPQLWKELYAASQGGTSFHLGLARASHVLTGALAMGGALVIVMGQTDALARRIGLIILTAGLVLAVPAGLWYMGTLNETARAAVQLPLLIGAGALAGLGYVAALLARGRRPAFAWLGLTGLTGGAVLLAVQRHLVRQALVSSYITTADWKLQPQWDAFAIFAVLLVGALGLIGYLFVRFISSPVAPKSKLSRSA